MLYYPSSSRTVKWNFWAYGDPVANWWFTGARESRRFAVKWPKKRWRFLLEHSTAHICNCNTKWKWLFQFHRDWFVVVVVVVVVTKGTKAFLRKLTTMGDVWIVTVSQGLEWIKNPTTLDKIKDFKPWKCDTPAPPPCPASQCKECYYADRQRLMSTCAPACPPHYPWVGNPDGN